MSVPIIGAVLEIGGKIIDKLFPDPAQKAQAQLELWRLQQEGAFKELDVELQSRLAQTEVNKIEAGSSSGFVAGWRPAVGWVCVLGLLYNYLGQPLLSWYSTAHALTPPPSPDLGDLFIMLGGILGLGGLRTYEKKQGVARQS